MDAACCSQQRPVTDDLSKYRLASAINQRQLITTLLILPTFHLDAFFIQRRKKYTNHAGYDESAHLKLSSRKLLKVFRIPIFTLKLNRKLNFASCMYDVGAITA